MKKNTNIKKSFLINVKKAHGHTWQGHIQWIEGQKEENFRSALEMIKLIDSAVEKDDFTEDNDICES